MSMPEVSSETRRSDPGWARPRSPPCWSDRGRLHLRSQLVGICQQLLRRGRPGRHEELEGVLLRLDRLLELHHRRQAAGLALGDGAVGPDLRLQQLRACSSPRPWRASPPSGCCTPAVKRWFGDVAGLGAGALLAITPVAALMFRFNNPDALLVLLLVAAAYCLIRALRRREHEVDPRRRCADRLRLPGQDDAGLPRAPGLRARLHDRRADGSAAAELGSCSPRARRSSSAPAGGWRSSRCGRSDHGR